MNAHAVVRAVATAIAAAAAVGALSILPARAQSMHVGAPPDSGPAAAAPADSAAGSGGPRDYVAEVRANFTPENRGYAAKRVTLAFVEPFYGILVAVLILFTGVSARMRDVAHSFATNRYLRVLVYIVLFSVVDFVLSFPLSWLQGFALEHQYNLSNQDFGPWFVDELKGLGLGVFFIGVVPIAALAYRAIAKYPRRWWLRHHCRQNPLQPYRSDHRQPRHPDHPWRPHPRRQRRHRCYRPWLLSHRPCRLRCFRR